MNDKEEFRQLFINYQINKHLYPKELHNSLEEFFNITDFYFNVVEALIEECSGKLTALAYQHYPDLVSVNSPIIKDYFKDINETVLFGLAYSMKRLVVDMKSGVDIKDKYPELENWRSFYLHPKPTTMERFERNMKRFPDDNEWEKYVEKENREMKRFFLWEEKRKTEFYHVFQPVLMRLYPALCDLEGDCWVLFAVNLRDEYEIWKSAMEEVELGIIYEMPPEFVKWEHKKFSDELSKRYEKYSKISMKKRNDQINTIKLEDEL
jgi:hypothetical protein